MAGSLYLVSCVSAKRSQLVPARDLYVSALFRKARAFVEATRSPWFVLSAEHGLLHPDAFVAPYERTLNTMPMRERRAWAATVLPAVCEQLAGVDRVIILAGESYREFIVPELRRRVAVEVPLEALRIGEQLRWLDQHTVRP